jgi:hypothetical protein
MFKTKKQFHFRAFWTRMPGFMETVQSAWHCPLHGAGAFRRLDCLLHNKARFLQSWSDRSIDNIKMQLVVAKEVVLQLEKARDRRQLTTHEESLRQEFKMKSLGLSSFQRTIARQESRLLWLREGDAPSKFFHIHANHRRRKNFIHELEHEGQRITSEECKADVIFQFFH